MTIFCEFTRCFSSTTPRHPRDLIVMHGGGGGHGGHGGHGGGWGGGGWGGDPGGGFGGGGNWVSMALIGLIVAYIVLQWLGVIGH
jgi:hypothetical protein